jgi:hypothetical protein
MGKKEKQAVLGKQMKSGMPPSTSKHQRCFFASPPYRRTNL